MAGKTRRDMWDSRWDLDTGAGMVGSCSCALGVSCRCCLLPPRGSGRRSEIGKLEGRYGAKKIKFEPKSVAKALNAIAN